MLIFVSGLAVTATLVATLGGSIRVARIEASLMAADASGLYVPLPSTAAYDAARLARQDRAQDVVPAMQAPLVAIGPCAGRDNCSQLQFRDSEWRPGPGDRPATAANTDVRLLLAEATLWQIAASVLGVERSNRANP